MISEADFQRMQLRCGGAREELPASGEPVTDEGKLHDGILADCRNRLWPVIHSRMDQPSTIGVGIPDMIIFADGGVVIIIEAKTKTGKMSTEQLAWKMVLERNGHKHYVVRSMEEYFNAINDARKPKA